MPAGADQMKPDEIWTMVNYVRTFADKTATKVKPRSGYARLADPMTKNESLTSPNVASEIRLPNDVSPVVRSASAALAWLRSERDVIFRAAYPFGCSLNHIFTADPSRKSLVLHPLLYRTDFQIKNALRWTNIGACREKAGQLVAGEQGMLQRRFRGLHLSNWRETGWRERSARGSQVLASILRPRRMLVLPGMCFVGPPLVVEVMQQRRYPPELLIRA